MPGQKQPIDTSKSLDALLADARADGFEQGMQVVNKALGYLTRQPQPRWARQVIEWIRKDVEKACGGFKEAFGDV